MPYLTVVHFLKCVQFTIICSPISVYFGIAVAFQNTSHYPLAIYKSTISENQSWFFTVNTMLITFFAKWTHRSLKFPMYSQYTIPPIKHNKLSMYLALRIQAVTEPIETISYFSVPWVVFLVVYFVHIFNRIKSEIYSKCDRRWRFYRWCFISEIALLLQIEV